MLKGKTAFITGGSSGYGKATARRLADEGVSVIIAARNEAELINAQRETGCAGFFMMDVTKYADWKKAYNFIKTKFGKLDILVNNAGGGVAIEEVTDQSVENIDKSIALNLNSVIYGSKIFAPMMKAAKNGTIINVSSVCAKEAWAGFSIYAAAKWGVLGFSKGLYVELRPHNVRVTCLIPAAANTNFQKNAGTGANEKPLMLTAKDIADSVYYICALPEHAVIEELTIWGIDQEVNPL